MTATRVRTELITDALRLACRAPSLHNSQPWRWVLTDDSVELFADRDRLVSGTDHTGRQALISCGAVLHHFCAAMAAAGWGTTVTRFPTADDACHVATVQFAEARSVTDEQMSRANAILTRHTDRLPFAAPPDPESLMHVLSAVAENHVVRLDVLSENVHEFLAEASHLTEVLRRYDAEYHVELDWWTDSFVAGQGIPRASLITATESDRVQIGRNFPVVARAERRTAILDDRAAVLVLSTLDDNRDSVLRCGEALSAVLLNATEAGLSSCPLTHITEVEPGREVVATLVGNGSIPQVIVRLGQAPALADSPPPTPRRPLDHVLRIERSRQC